MKNNEKTGFTISTLEEKSFINRIKLKKLLIELKRLISKDRIEKRGKMSDRNDMIWYDTSREEKRHSKNECQTEMIRYEESIEETE